MSPGEILAAIGGAGTAVFAAAVIHALVVELHQRRARTERGGVTPLRETVHGADVLDWNLVEAEAEPRRVNREPQQDVQRERAAGGPEERSQGEPLE